MEKQPPPIDPKIIGVDRNTTPIERPLAKSHIPKPQQEDPWSLLLDLFNYGKDTRK